MTITYTRRFRFPVPDFTTAPWHAQFATLCDAIDAAVFNAVVATSTVVWDNSLPFTVGQMATDPDDGSLWVVSVDHTSAAAPTTFAQDRLAHPTFWSTPFILEVTTGYNLVADGAGAILTPGLKAYLPVHFDCTIVGVKIFGDQAGSVVVDIYKCAQTDFDAGATHPVVADSITAAAKPTISGGTRMSDTLLVGWDTILEAGDVLAINIDSVATFRQITVTIEVRREL